MVKVLMVLGNSVKPISNRTCSYKTLFLTIARKDEPLVKRTPTPKADNDDNYTDTTPRYNRREPTDTRRTQRGYSARQTPGRVRPPRVSRAFESKFHALEKRQRNLVQQTKLVDYRDFLCKCWWWINLL